MAVLGVAGVEAATRLDAAAASTSVSSALVASTGVASVAGADVLVASSSVAGASVSSAGVLVSGTSVASSGVLVACTGVTGARVASSSVSCAGVTSTSVAVVVVIVRSVGLTVDLDRDNTTEWTGGSLILAADETDTVFIGNLATADLVVGDNDGQGVAGHLSVLIDTIFARSVLDNSHGRPLITSSVGVEEALVGASTIGVDLVHGDIELTTTRDLGKLLAIIGSHDLGNVLLEDVVAAGKRGTNTGRVGHLLGVDGVDTVFVVLLLLVVTSARVASTSVTGSSVSCAGVSCAGILVAASSTASPGRSDASLSHSTGCKLGVGHGSRLAVGKLTLVEARDVEARDVEGEVGKGADLLVVVVATASVACTDVLVASTSVAASASASVAGAGVACTRVARTRVTGARALLLLVLLARTDTKVSSVHLERVLIGTSARKVGVDTKTSSLATEVARSVDDDAVGSNQLHRKCRSGEERKLLAGSHF